MNVYVPCPRGPFRLPRILAVPLVCFTLLTSARPTEASIPTAEHTSSLDNVHGIEGVGTRTGCPPPTVIFDLAESYLFGRDTCANASPVLQQLSETAPTPSLSINRTLRFQSAAEHGSAKVLVAGAAGHLTVYLESRLTVPSVGGQVHCSTVGVTTNASPDLVGLAIYVLEDAGRHYWVEGGQKGRGEIVESRSIWGRKANTACCQASGSPGFDICECAHSYDVSDGTLTSSMPRLIYQGRSYRRVRLLKFDTNCLGLSGSLSAPGYSIRATTQYELRVGLDPAPGGGPPCPDENGCDYSWGMPEVGERNNCYNFATGRRADPFRCDPDYPRFCTAQPGLGSGPDYIAQSAITCDAVTAYLLRDGLNSTSADGDCGGKCKVALWVRPGYDYHFIKQDSDGLWSHKPGLLLPTRLDANGLPITDPANQLFDSGYGPYTEFCGYFCVPDEATIRRPTQEGGYALVDPFPELGLPDTSFVAAQWWSGVENPVVALDSTQDAELSARLTDLPLAPDPGWSFAEPIPDTYLFERRGVPGAILARAGIVALQDSVGAFSYFVDTQGLAGWAKGFFGLHPSSTEQALSSSAPWSLRVVSQPARGSARIELRLQQSLSVRLTIFDASGREVRQLVNGAVPSGDHVFSWDGTDASGRTMGAGVYFVRAHSNQAVRSEKLILLRR